ncbi:phosphoglycerate kinase [Magnetospirillum sp. ME-1]|nr:phosphoglycerate kinase [Magnetospirillum sp. ME-1]
MGLDMYAYRMDPSIPGEKATDFDLPEGTRAKQFHYWRKHPNLHGWMEQLYRSKGGTDEFNCATVLVSEEDLDALEAAVKGEELPETHGFFFGASHPEQKADDLVFIARARAVIASGDIVVYTSWW